MIEANKGVWPHYPLVTDYLNDSHCKVKTNKVYGLTIDLVADYIIYVIRTVLFHSESKAWFPYEEMIPD